ncbi:MAG: HAMP domain-containing protein [Verrucomicrobia bacterium]|nr:HAMP domain-containing protein [Verrucomicrobiota bacterium]
MLKKIKVSYKIVLMICAVALPLVAATIFATIKGFNKDINFALQEKKGNAFQRPLAALLDAIPQHQWLAQAAQANPAARTFLAEKEEEIDRIFTELGSANSKYGKDLQFTEQGLAKRKRQGKDPASVEAAWQKLKQSQATLSAGDLAEQHKQLVADVRTMITHAGDTSSLVLDPDLDSCYLMDATLVALPQTQDRLGVIAGFGANVLRQQRDKITAQDISQLIVHAALLKEADVDRLNADVDAALNEDAGSYGISESLQKNLSEPVKAYNTACQEFGALATAAAADPASVTSQAFLDAGQKARAAAFALWKSAVAELDVLLQKRASSIQTTRTLTIVGVAVALLLSGLIAFFVSRSITQPLGDLTMATHRILRGEFSVRAPVHSDDEIGELAESFNSMVDARLKAQGTVETENKRLQSNIQDLLVVVSEASDGKLGVRAKVSEGALGNIADALNLMLENVGETISNAKVASDKVATAASEITNVAQQLEKGEQRQTQEMLLTSEGVRDLDGQAQLVLKNCLSATTAAENGRRAAEQGAKAVRDVIQGMEKIRENTQANAKKIKRLGDRSMEIAGIVKIIGDISAKTDMLALNASIEAARAGEQGRGFTVVAEQVRGLADRTKTLTNQIEKLVGDIQKETGEAVAQMETQTQEVEAGTKAAQSAGGTLENIVTSNAESSELVSQINQAATKQASRTQEMIQTVNTINQVVTESAEHVRDTRESSLQLMTLSSELNKRLAQFEFTAEAVA